MSWVNEFFSASRYHENCRTFQDRLVNSEDRLWFRDVLRDKLSSAFEVDVDNVLSNDFLIYGDFMVPNVDVKVYAEVTDYDKVCSLLSD